MTIVVKTALDEVPGEDRGEVVTHDPKITGDGPFTVVECACGYVSMWGGYTFAQCAAARHRERAAGWR